MGKWSGRDGWYAVMLTPGLVPDTMDCTTIEGMTDKELLYIIKQELKRGHEVRLITKPEN